MAEAAPTDVAPVVPLVAQVLLPPAVAPPPAVVVQSFVTTPCLKEPNLYADGMCGRCFIENPLKAPYGSRTVAYINSKMNRKYQDIPKHLPVFGFVFARVCARSRIDVQVYRRARLVGRSAVRLLIRLVGWLLDELVGWLAVPVVGRLVGWSACRLVAFRWLVGSHRVSCAFAAGSHHVCS
jgi:hypothetical protein